MSSFREKLKVVLSVSWLKTIYFNFKYLPLRQAIHIPIFLSKPKLLKCKGSVEINAKEIKTGMIRLGHYCVSLYPNKGLTWENQGGKAIFQGSCHIGNYSFISIGKQGRLNFGDKFTCTAALKLACHHSIKFKRNVLIAWEVIIMDTAFHRIKHIEHNREISSMDAVEIGRDSWITSRTTILKGARIPDFSIIAAGSILNKDYSHLPSYSLLAGQPLSVKARGVWRDYLDDKIDFSQYRIS